MNAIFNSLNVLMTPITKLMLNTTGKTRLIMLWLMLILLFVLPPYIGYGVSDSALLPSALYYAGIPITLAALAGLFFCWHLAKRIESKGDAPALAEVFRLTPGVNGLFILAVFVLNLVFGVNKLLGLPLPLSIGLFIAGSSIFNLLGQVKHERKKEPRPYDARLADKQDINPMQLTPREANATSAILIGVLKTGVLGIRAGHGNRKELGHVLVTAPTRSGKGRNLAANLLNWAESTIVLDIKGENYQNTAGYRKSIGKVFALSPTGQGHRYDPFLELQHSDEALLTAAKVLVEDKDDMDRAFGERAANGLLAGLLAAKLEQVPTLPMLDALLAEGIEGYVQALENYNNPKINKALTIFLGYKPNKFEIDKALKDKFLISTWSMLTTRVAPLLTDGVLAMTSGSDFKAEDFYQDTTSLYLIFPESEGEATGKIFKLIILSLMLGLIRSYDASFVGKKQGAGSREQEENQNQTANKKVLLALDEVGRVPIPRLNDYISTLAGRDVSVMLYIQSLSQLEEVYGRAASETILDNCRTQIFYPTPNVRTQEYISKLGGYTEFEDSTYSQGETQGAGSFSLEGGFEEGSTSYSESVSTRLSKVELIQPSSLRMMPPDATYVFTADLPPIYAWRVDPAFVADEVMEKAHLLNPPELPQLELKTIKLSTALEEESQIEIEAGDAGSRLSKARSED